MGKEAFVLTLFCLVWGSSWGQVEVEMSILQMFIQESKAGNGELGVNDWAQQQTPLRLITANGQG